ncbi:MAG: glycosyltransferase family 2 protein [Dehalococcoidia bacterium]|nr:glycosyltransferase family 2 protein [Dehalococcoidia bacterium]
MPAYDEASTIEGVLDDLYPRVDRVIVVDDGSTDGTGPLLDRWAQDRDRCTVVHLSPNQGLSAALRAGWDRVRDLVAEGVISEDDIAFSIDADGQHEPAALHALADRLIEGGYALVIGNRDLSYHGSYKRLGNGVMTWIGRLTSGAPLHDIESGYRMFRVGPLLEAQQYYRGYRYSETVEVAVILARLGHRVDNDLRIEVPVARTRTRLKDAAVDAFAMPLAWYRLACWRDCPQPLRSVAGATLALLPFLVLAAALLVMLSHPYFVADDAAQSYYHVRYLSESLFTRHEWPWHVATLEGGHAVMFPYAAIPWIPLAFLYPLLGDWIVTASMAAGSVFLVYGVQRWQPAVRRPVLLAVCLLNPIFWSIVLEFQLPTVWAFGAAACGAASLRERHPRAALALGVVAIVAHAMMGLVALVACVALDIVTGRTPLRATPWVVASVLLASPAMYSFARTPLLDEVPAHVVLQSAIDNMLRLTVLALPALLAARPWLAMRWQTPLLAAGVALTLLVLSFEPPSGLWERSHPRFAEYLQLHPVDPALVYRVVTTTNHEDGMIEFLRGGATLAGEFFTESEGHRSFRTAQRYACFLDSNRVGRVVLSGEYLHAHHTDEVSLLDRLVTSRAAAKEYDGTDGTVAYRIGDLSSVTDAGANCGG